MKGSMLQEDITNLNVHIHKNSVKIHEAKTDKTVRRNRQKPTVRVGDLKSLF